MRGRRRGFRSADEAPQDAPPADDVPQGDPAPEVPQRQASLGAGSYNVQWSPEGEHVTVATVELAAQWDITRWRRGRIG